MVLLPDVKTLEGITCSDVFQFLRHLWRCAVQLFRDALLLMGVHGVKLLTQVSIDHILKAYKQSQWEKWNLLTVKYINWEKWNINCMLVFYLYWEIIWAEAEVITTTQWRKLRAHVHLQVLKEVMILKTDETYILFSNKNNHKNTLQPTSLFH